MIAAVDTYNDKFDKFSIGALLLTSDDNYSRVADTNITVNSGKCLKKLIVKYKKTISQHEL